VKHRLSVQVVICLVIVTLGCSKVDLSTQQGLLDTLKLACKKKDTGLLMTFIDINYEDDLGGPGRLDDDLRQLFTVYGSIVFDANHIETTDDIILADLSIKGQKLSFKGPIQLRVHQKQDRYIMSSGLFTELRGIVHVLRQRRIALEERNIERMQNLVSTAYNGEVGGRAELLAKVERELLKVDALAIVVDNLDIVVLDNQAKISQLVSIITRRGGRKDDSQKRLELQMRKEGSRWRIIGGLG
jgi:hypothetical protein